MFNQRTHPLFRQARQIVRSGQLGQLKRLQWTVTNWYRTQSYYDSGSWRASWAGEGGGVLLNQAPHQLDLLQWIFGMPEQVWATCACGKYHHIEVEDDATLVMQYANGATATFITTTGEYRDPADREGNSPQRHSAELHGGGAAWGGAAGAGI